MLFFFFIDPPTTEIYTLSLHDAFPISVVVASYNGARTLDECLASLARLNYPDYEVIVVDDGSRDATPQIVARYPVDRKSTRLNSSHPSISYAVFCLKKKIIILQMLFRL